MGIWAARDMAKAEPSAKKAEPFSGMAIHPMQWGNLDKVDNAQLVHHRVPALSLFKRGSLGFSCGEPDEVGPDARGKTFCLLLAGPAIRAFAKSEPP